MTAASYETLEAICRESLEEGRRAERTDDPPWESLPEPMKEGVRHLVRTFLVGVERAHLQLAPIEAVLASPEEHAAFRAQVEAAVCLLGGAVGALMQEIGRHNRGDCGASPWLHPWTHYLVETAGEHAAELLEQLCPEARLEAASREAFVAQMVRGHVEALDREAVPETEPAPGPAVGSSAPPDGPGDPGRIIEGTLDIGEDGVVTATVTGDNCICTHTADHRRSSTNPACKVHGLYRAQARGFVSVGALALFAALCIAAAFAAAFLGGCGGSPSSGPVVDQGDAAPMLDAAHVDAHDASADALDAGAADGARAPALCCQTGQNILVCDPSAPFGCALAGTHPTDAGTCLDPGCVVGASCQGFNGAGVVTLCAGGDQ